MDSMTTLTGFIRTKPLLLQNIGMVMYFEAKIGNSYQAGAEQNKNLMFLDLQKYQKMKNDPNKDLYDFVGFLSIK